MVIVLPTYYSLDMVAAADSSLTVAAQYCRGDAMKPEAAYQNIYSYTYVYNTLLMGKKLFVFRFSLPYMMPCRTDRPLARPLTDCSVEQQLPQY